MPNYDPAQIRQAYQQHIYFKNKRNNELKGIFLSGLAIGGTLILSLIIQTFFVLFLQARGYYTAYSQSSLFQNAFNIVAVDIFSLIIPFFLLSLILKRNYGGSNLIPRKKLNMLQHFSWVSVGMACCVGANFITSFVIALFKQFGYKLTQPDYNDPSNVIECIVIVFSTALAPALCEEFAMRCCTLGALKKYGKGFAVFAVSVVFGLIHGNVIQFVFAFLLGLVFGYITVVTDSVIPAMFIHGFNNGLSVINDILKYATGSEKAGEYFGSAIYIMWLVFAGIGLVYLIMKKELFPKRQKKLKEPYAPSFGLKVLCLLPGLFIPICILVYMTTLTVVPI